MTTATEAPALDSIHVVEADDGIHLITRWGTPALLGPLDALRLAWSLVGAAVRSTLR